MKKTDELLKIIKKSDDLDDFLEQHDREFININIPEYLNAIIEEKKLVKSTIISASGLDRVYAYQILNGTRTPSRDKLIQLSFGIGLDFAETQKLLKYSRNAPLYAHNRRDSIVIFAINQKLSFIELNILLDSKGEKVIE